MAKIAIEHNNQVNFESKAKSEYLSINLRLPIELEGFFEYLETYFFVKRRKYLENIIKSEINSRKEDLNF